MATRNTPTYQSSIASRFGDSYEYLIKKFADLTNRKAGEFYTPRTIVELMVRVLAPQADDTVYDPACGTGGMLLETLQQVRESGGDERLMLGHLFGQERNLTTAAIARMNLFLHGAEDFQIVRGDTLRQPAFLTGDKLATFDCVIANPPFSLSSWGEDTWPNDPWGRNLAGTPPKKYGDWAWVQHMITSMASATGRMAVVLPHGALFRMGAEGKIRSKVLDLAGYISKPDDVDIPSVEEATKALEDALDAAWAAEDRLNQILAERGIA